MAILGGFQFFSLFSSQSRPDRLRKGISPLSSAIKRQHISTKALPTSKKPNCKNETEVVTENSILNDFPRPNLLPTLNFSNVFGGFNRSQCGNCSGPHSTDFCPC